MLLDVFKWIECIIPVAILIDDPNMIGINSKVWSKDIGNTKERLVNSDWSWDMRGLRIRNSFLQRGAFDQELERWLRFQWHDVRKDITKLFFFFLMENYIDAILAVRIQSPHMDALTQGIYEWMNQPIKAFLSQPPALPPGSQVSRTSFLT